MEFWSHLFQAHYFRRVQYSQMKGGFGKQDQDSITMMRVKNSILKPKFFTQTKVILCLIKEFFEEK